jgi:hypothetical protein
MESLHSLVTLEVPPLTRASETSSSSEALTRFAAEARYPGDIEPIIPEDVALAIEIAEGVVEWARVQIREVPGTR